MRNKLFWIFVGGVLLYKMGFIPAKWVTAVQHGIGWVYIKGKDVLQIIMHSAYINIVFALGIFVLLFLLYRSTLSILSHLKKLLTTIQSHPLFSLPFPRPGMFPRNFSSHNASVEKTENKDNAQTEEEFYKIYQPLDIKVTLKDVIGQEEAKNDLQEIIAYLTNPHYKQLGIRLPKGVLLYGPPGVGKTLLAKAVAGEAAVPFIYVSATALIEKYVGVGAKRVRKLFEVARNQRKAILFIDELDAVGFSRNKEGVGEYVQTLNQLLVEMDGFDTEHAQIVVIAATNRADILDPALLRPGRFDRKIKVTLPTREERIELLKFYLQKVKHDRQILSHVEELADLTLGFSGADIANLINEAALLSLRKGYNKVKLQYLYEAMDKIMLGHKKNIVLSPEERVRTAYHEAGHALVNKLLGGQRVVKVSILPRASALGYVIATEQTEKRTYTKKELRHKIAGLLAGLAAEELYYGKDNISTGAASDLRKATQLAYEYIALYGFDEEFGPVYAEFLPSLKEKAEEKTQQLLKQIYHDVFVFLKEQATLHQTIVDALLEKEVLSGHEFNKIIEEHSVSVAAE